MVTMTPSKKMLSVSTFLSSLAAVQILCFLKAAALTRRQSQKPLLYLNTKDNKARQKVLLQEER